MFAGTLGWLLQPSTRLVSRFLPAHWCIIVKNASLLQHYINARKRERSNDTLLNLKVFVLQENNFRWPFVAKLYIMYLARCSISNWKLNSLDYTSDVQIHWNVKSSTWITWSSQVHLARLVLAKYCYILPDGKYVRISYEQMFFLLWSNSFKHAE